MRDAEANAEEDKKFAELVEAAIRPTAGARHPQDPEGRGRQGTDAEKEAIEAAVKELEEAIKGNDMAAIEAKSEALSNASMPLMQKLYAEQQQAGGTQPGAGHEKADDGVVDAEFEDVSDKK